MIQEAQIVVPAVCNLPLYEYKLILRPVQTGRNVFRPNYFFEMSLSKKEDSGSERPEAYPKPTQTDTQVQNQLEYIDQEPNSFEKKVSDTNDDAANKNDIKKE